jgi:site-specific DNA recombinase
MKAIIFARVSTQEQMREGHSIPAQIEKMREYCKKYRIEIQSEYQIDESSTKDERKKFEIVLKEIKSSKECIALIIETIDRLQRSYTETVIFDALRKEARVELHFLRENLRISKDSNSNEIARWDLGVFMARNYVNQLSDNVKRSIQQKINMGQWISKAPYGYRNILNEDSKKELIVDPAAEKIVRKVYELYSTGSYSMRGVREKLAKDDGVKWSSGHLDAVLKNPFYHGQMLIKGKLFPHKYPPLISKIMFDRVQEIKKGFNKKRFKYAGLPYLYRGLIRCEACGLAITPEKHKGLVYYHCTQFNGKHGAQWLREEEITGQLSSVFAGLQIPEALLNQVLKSLRSIHDGKIDYQKNNQKALDEQRKIVTQRMNALYVDKLDGRITQYEYDNFYHSFREELAGIQAEQELLMDAEDNYFLTANYLLKLASRAKDLFISSEVTEKRQLVKLVLSNLRLKEKNLIFTVSEPFNTIRNMHDRTEMLPKQDSNLRHGD